jgi:biotin carboxyl carrier protein
MRYFVTLGARETEIDVTALPDGRWDVRLDGRPVAVNAVSIGTTLSLLIEGRVVDLELAGSFPKVDYAVHGARGEATIETERTRTDPSLRASARVREAAVLAPMPGRIVRLLVAEGDRVEAGTPLIVIEAMKMENELRAGHAATIARILVEPGVTVEAGAKLVELE